MAHGVGFPFGDIYIWELMYRVEELEPIFDDYDTQLAAKASTSSVTSALSGKENTITPGTTAQYWRGDKTWQTLPTGGSGTVTSVGLTSSDLTVSGSPVTTSGNITANLSTTGVSADTYSGVTVDTKGRVTAGTKRSFSSATRSLNSVFQISTTRDVLASYSVDISTSVSLAGGAVGTVYLEYADDSSFTTGVTEVGRFVNGNTGTLVVGLTLNQTNTAPVSGVIPTSKYVRLRTQNNTGSPTFTYRSGQEVSL